jgi:hypothetical protein
MDKTGSANGQRQTDRLSHLIVKYRPVGNEANDDASKDL